MNSKPEVLSPAHQRLSGNRPKAPWPLLFVLLSTTLVAARLFRLVNRYAVNILFWDQWDFSNATLFQKHSLWQMFRWQHGPHRQGVGAIVSWLIEPMFHWSSRAEAFLACAIFVLAALLALYLKNRLFGPITYADVVVPLIFLTPLEYESLFGSTNLSHGPLPILLLMIYCIGWTQPGVRVRYAWILITNFLLIYTGFGLFVGLITPVLLVLDYRINNRAGRPGPALAGSLAALLIAVASLLSFFIGYKLDPAAACFKPFSEPLLQYLRYMDLMFVNFTGIKGLGIFPALLGGLLLAWTTIALLIALTELLARREEADAAHMVSAVLLVFSLLFCANTALGRLCLGLLTAQSSRYVPYLIPAFLGIYFSCLGSRNRSLKTAGTIVFLAIAVSAALPVRIGDRSMMAQYHDVKNNWRECYLQHHDIGQCDALTGTKIYPWPESGHLKEKLDFLEEKKLNLYAARE
ncbi:MAG TPA: hypothetical protein VFB76_14375 [Candidatus Angelobacter sp.]|nr:hypothetical protein [Candidatus Angelobacter sp.]